MRIVLRRQTEKYSGSAAEHSVADRLRYDIINVKIHHAAEPFALQAGLGKADGWVSPAS
jgi:hypothetical protein